MPSPHANAGQDAARLELGQAVERTMGRGETHRYRIAINRGLHLRATITQQGVDVVVTILDPAGRKVARIDRANDAYGPERASIIAEVAGDYLIEVEAARKSAPLASYVITASDLRAATDDDRRRIEAERVVSEGEARRGEGLGDSLTQGVEKFSQAIGMWQSLRDRYEEAVATYGRGLCYRDLGDYYNAIRDFRKSASQMETLEDRNGEAIAQSALGWAYLYVGENGQARDYFLLALQTYQSLGNLRSQGISLSGLGWTYALSSEPEQALEQFQKSLELRRTVEDRHGEILTLSAIGITYNRLGRQDVALDYLRQSLQLSPKVGNLQVKANPLSKLGWVHLTSHRLAEARDYLEQALRICRSSGDRAGEADALYPLARVEMEQGYLEQARRHIEASLEIIESLRWRNNSLQLRSAYLSLAQDHYQLCVEVLMRMHREDPAAGYAAAALRVSERARARSLLDALAESQIDVRGEVDPRLIAEERRLQRNLNDLSVAQLRVPKDKYQAAMSSSIEANIKATINQLEETHAQIKTSNPRYAALTQPQPVNLEQIQRGLLDNNTLLLEYALGDERSYLFMVSPSSLQTFTLPPRAEIEAQARRVYNLLSSRASSARDETPQQRDERIASAEAELPRQAAELSRMILAPAAAQLGRKRLLVVAQGAMQLIPFAALPEPGTEIRSDGEAAGRREGETEPRKDEETAGQRDGKAPGRKDMPPVPPSLRPSVALPPHLSYTPLLVNHEVVNLPSASTLAALRQETARRRPAPKAIALLADPIFEKSDARLKLANSQTQHEHLSSPVQTSPAQTASSQRPQELMRAIKAFGEPNDELTFPRLTSTGWEAEQIAKMSPAGQVFKALSFDANLQTATSGKLSDYRIVHFASHGFIHATHPDLSGVVLSLIDRNGKDQDGFLRLHEIYNLKLSADLVSLSACRTGIGKEVKGEGLMSLTRGFMYAGAPRVLVSAWEVQDRSSAMLMVKFYRRLLGPKRLSASAALRDAQLEMWRDKKFTAPYFWAGFTLHGEWK